MMWIPSTPNTIVSSPSTRFGASVLPPQIRKLKSKLFKSIEDQKDITDLLKTNAKLFKRFPSVLSEALFPAINFGNLSTLEALLKAGAFINQQDKQGYTPLHRAVWAIKPEMVKYLANKGADVNIPTFAFKVSPLQTAATLVNYEMVKILLSLGANPHHTCISGQNAAYAAAYIKNKATLDLLQTVGPKPTILSHT